MDTSIKSNSNVGVTELQQYTHEITAYPNPVANSITFKTAENGKLLELTKMVLKLFNSEGKLVEFKPVTFEKSVSIDLQQGIYFYVLSDLNDTIIKSGKIAIEN